MVVDVGFTTTEEEVELVFHEYEFPLEAVKVAASPLHKSVFPIMLAFGPALTVTCAFADLLHPLALVTVTE